MGGYLMLFAIRYGCNLTYKSTVGTGVPCLRIKQYCPLERLTPYATAITLAFESICRKCFAFSNFILSDFFRERSQNQESLQGVAHRAAPPEACPLGFAAQKSPVGFYKSHSVSLLKYRAGGARCTCFSQNDAIAPRGVRAVC